MLTKEQLDQPVLAVQELIRNRFVMLPNEAPWEPTPLSVRIIRDCFNHYDGYQRWPLTEVMAVTVLYLAEALNESQARLKVEHEHETMLQSLFFNVSLCGVCKKPLFLHKDHTKPCPPEETEEMQ